MNTNWTVVERTTQHQQWKSNDGKTVLNIVKSSFTDKHQVFEERGKLEHPEYLNRNTGIFHLTKEQIKAEYGIQL